jgi:hypothetical protein
MCGDIHFLGCRRASLAESVQLKGALARGLFVAVPALQEVLLEPTTKTGSFIQWASALNYIAAEFQTGANFHNLRGFAMEDALASTVEHNICTLGRPFTSLDLPNQAAYKWRVQPVFEEAKGENPSDVDLVVVGIPIAEQPEPQYQLFGEEEEEQKVVKPIVIVGNLKISPFQLKTKKLDFVHYLRDLPLAGCDVYLLLCSLEAAPVDQIDDFGPDALLDFWQTRFANLELSVSVLPPLTLEAELDPSSSTVIISEGGLVARDGLVADLQNGVRLSHRVRIQGGKGVGTSCLAFWFNVSYFSDAVTHCLVCV